MLEDYDMSVLSWILALTLLMLSETAILVLDISLDIVDSVGCYNPCPGS
jgi:hypothetical protein